MEDIGAFQEYLKRAFEDIDVEQITTLQNLDTYDINREVQEMIVQVRLREGITQQQLSERSGISQANISRIETGKMHPSIDVLKKLADGLGKRLRISLYDQEVEE